MVNRDKKEQRPSCAPSFCNNYDTKQTLKSSKKFYKRYKEAHCCSEEGAFLSS